MVIDTHQKCDQIKLKYNQRMQGKGAKSMHNYGTQILQINQSKFSHCSFIITLRDIPTVASIE